MQHEGRISQADEIGSDKPAAEKILPVKSVLKIIRADS